MKRTNTYKKVLLIEKAIIKSCIVSLLVFLYSEGMKKEIPVEFKQRSYTIMETNTKTKEITEETKNIAEAFLGKQRIAWITSPIDHPNFIEAIKVGHKRNRKYLMPLLQYKMKLLQWENYKTLEIVVKFTQSEFKLLIKNGAIVNDHPIAHPYPHAVKDCKLLTLHFDADSK